jgi:Ca-activated chloride channel homolog
VGSKRILFKKKVMMKVQYILNGLLMAFLLMTAPSLFAQEWRDSLNAARQYYQKQEYGKALEKLQSAQKKAPEGVDLSKELGQSAYRNLQFKEAEELYKHNAEAAKSKEEKAKAYHNLGNSLMQQKKYSDAIDAYKESLRNNPSNDKTRHNLTEAMRQREEQKQQQNKNNQQQNNQNNNNQQKNNNNNQQQNKNQQQQQNNNQHQQNNEGQNKEDQQQNQDKGSSKLHDKAVEKKLDDLMKQEAATKRKMGEKQGTSLNKSGKDW